MLERYRTKPDMADGRLPCVAGILRVLVVCPPMMSFCSKTWISVGVNQAGMRNLRGVRTTVAKRWHPGEAL